jgi:hypothetical protein
MDIVKNVFCVCFVTQSEVKHATRPEPMAAMYPSLHLPVLMHKCFHRLGTRWSEAVPMTRYSLFCIYDRIMSVIVLYGV